MQKIRNIPTSEIVNVFGQPYPFIDSNCPVFCTGQRYDRKADAWTGCDKEHLTAEHCRFEGAACITPGHIAKELRPLSGWIKSVLINLKQVCTLSMEDTMHAHAILRACLRTEERRRDTITLEEADWKWLKLALFDDAYAVKTHIPARDAQGQPLASQPPVAAFATQFFDPWLVGLFKYAIECLPEPRLADDDDDRNDDVPISLPELQDAAVG